MQIPYREVVAGPELRTRFPDAALISDYLEAGSPAGELIYLGFGETWTQVPDGLAEQLHAVPRHAHGYVISQHGLPRLQRVLRSYLARSHRLDSTFQAGQDYEVAVSHGGTRNAMFDFARLILADREFGPAVATTEVPVAIATMPGWDYAGVVEPLGYRMRYLDTGGGPDGGPSAEAAEELAEAIAAAPGERLALVVINAQHNPTGANWSAETVRRLVQVAWRAGAAVLLDDAYYGVHDPDLVPTSALDVLLSERAEFPPAVHRRWLAVRSLGKQFHCNGWGIGALTADPATLAMLVNSVQFHRSFASATPLQEAMAGWLEDPESERFLEVTGREYTHKRAVIGGLLTSTLGYPGTEIQLGLCGPYLRVPIPAGHADSLRRTGVLLGVDRWNHPAGNPSAAYCRIFLGPPLSTLVESVQRLAEAGCFYEPNRVIR